MHAYIVTGGTKTQRIESITKFTKARLASPHDIITVIPEPTSIGVDSVRAVQLRLSIRPIGGSTHIAVVYDAHAMTVDAQLAFLKTLEEPPGGALIVLETGQPDALLPTIISRCHVIRIKQDKVVSDPSDNRELSQSIKTVKQLLEAPVGKRLQIIDTIVKTRQDAATFIDLAITALRQELVLHRDHGGLPQNNVTKLLRALLSARTQLQGNITPKLILDTAFL